MIDPEFWLDEDLAKLSAHARLLYIGLWNICDDNYATFPDRPEWVKIQVFPYEDVNTHDLLNELSVSGKIVLFESGGKNFYFIKNFFKYQTINRPSNPKYPPFSDGSVSTHPEVKLSEVKEVKLKEGAAVINNSRETLKEKWGSKSKH